jgi:hypothetical protein
MSGGGPVLWWDRLSIPEAAHPFDHRAAQSSSMFIAK